MRMDFRYWVGIRRARGAEEDGMELKEEIVRGRVGAIVARDTE